MNNTFNIKRLSQFILRQASMNFTPFFIGIGGIFGILLIIAILTAHFNPNDFGNIFPLGMVIFFASGFIFTSGVFSELNSSGKSYSFLTLPVSSLEKIIGSWLLTSPVYIIVYNLLLAIIYFISTISAGIETSTESFFGTSFLNIVAIYAVLQTIFFLGACAFKNYNFLKTLLSIFLFFVILASFAGSLAGILFQGHFDGVNMDFDNDSSLEYFISKTVPSIFWYGLAPFLLIVSYFKLKEREV